LMASSSYSVINIFITILNLFSHIHKYVISCCPQFIDMHDVDFTSITSNPYSLVCLCVFVNSWCVFPKSLRSSLDKNWQNMK
jgi:hypothetical protein